MDSGYWRQGDVRAILRMELSQEGDRLSQIVPRS